MPRPSASPARCGFVAALHRFAPGAALVRAAASSSSSFFCSLAAQDGAVALAAAVVDRRIGRRRRRPLRRILRQAADGRRHAVADATRSRRAHSGRQQHAGGKNGRGSPRRCLAISIEVRSGSRRPVRSAHGERPHPGRAKLMCVQAIAGSLWPICQSNVARSTPDRLRPALRASCGCRAKPLCHMSSAKVRAAVRAARSARTLQTEARHADKPRRAGHERPSISRRSPSNLARMVEEGGKALAAYLKPREEGQVDDQNRRRIDRRGQDLRPGRRILAVRPAARGRSCSRSLGKAYLDLWAHRGQAAWPARTAEPVAEPDPRDKRFADPEWSQNQFFDFLKQAYLLTTSWADHLVSDAEGLDPHTRQKAEFYVQADRQRDLAVEFRADQSGAAARDAESATPRTWCAACTCWPRTSRPAAAICKIRQSDASKFEVGAQSRAHARQGDLPERADAAHPVRADDRDGAEAAAADRAAVDQQVLHARSQRRRNPSSNGASTRA